MCRFLPCAAEDQGTHAEKKRKENSGRKSRIRKTRFLNGDIRKGVWTPAGLASGHRMFIGLHTYLIEPPWPHSRFDPKSACTAFIHLCRTQDIMRSSNLLTERDLADVLPQLSALTMLSQVFECSAELFATDSPTDLVTYHMLQADRQLSSRHISRVQHSLGTTAILSAASSSSSIQPVAKPSGRWDLARPILACTNASIAHA